MLRGCLDKPANADGGLLACLDVAYVAVCDVTPHEGAVLALERVTRDRVVTTDLQRALSAQQAAEDLVAALDRDIDNGGSLALSDLEAAYRLAASVVDGDARGSRVTA